MAITLDAENALYYFDRGITYRYLDNAKLAKENLKKALILAQGTGDPKLQTNIVEALQYIKL